MDVLRSHGDFTVQHLDLDLNQNNSQEYKLKAFPGTASLSVSCKDWKPAPTVNGDRNTEKSKVEGGKKH